jgi:hypothetical protein
LESLLTKWLLQFEKPAEDGRGDEFGHTEAEVSSADSSVTAARMRARSAPVPLL